MNHFFSNLCRASIPFLFVIGAGPRIAHAETIVMPLDTIVAVPSDDEGITGPQAVCDDGDPLCAPEFLCRDDGNGRTCETVEGWVERAYAARRTNTVGPYGWR